MCLSAAKVETEKLKQQISKKGGVIKVYKVYLISNLCLNTPHFDSYRGGMIKKPGAIISNRPKTDVVWDKGFFANTRRKNKTGQTINEGIHVFLTSTKADEYLNHRENRVTVELSAFADDLVGVGQHLERDVAVFRKVTLSQSEWDKIFPPTYFAKRQSQQNSKKGSHVSIRRKK